MEYSWKKLVTQEDLDNLKTIPVEGEADCLSFFTHDINSKLVLRPTQLKSNNSGDVLTLRAADNSDPSNISMNPWGINTESGNNKATVTPWNIAISNSNDRISTNITPASITVDAISSTSGITRSMATIDTGGFSILGADGNSTRFGGGSVQYHGSTFTFPEVDSGMRGMFALVEHIQEAVHMYYEYHNAGIIPLTECLVTYITSNNKNETLEIANGIATDNTAVPSAEWYILMLPSKVFSPSDGSSAKWTGLAIYPTKTLGISSIGSRQFNLESGETFVKIQTGNSGASQWSLKKYI